MIEIYGGTKEMVEKQLKCKHNWSGPSIDEVSRYCKCKRCFCLNRDMNQKQYKDYLKSIPKVLHTLTPEQLDEVKKEEREEGREEAQREMREKLIGLFGLDEYIRTKIYGETDW